jgi:hypothetical protein
MALRERDFCGCEIPFWTNKNGHAFGSFAIFGKDGLNRARIGLKRSDATSQIGPKVVEATAGGVIAASSRSGAPVFAS